MTLRCPKLSKAQIITIFSSLIVIGVTVGIIVYFGVRDDGSDEGTTTTTGAPAVTDPPEVTEEPEDPEPPEVTEDPEVTDEPVTEPSEIETVAITIAQGDLLGAYRNTDQNVRFAAFEDIPYAQPPVGLLRFREPLAAVPWEGIFNATTNIGISCVQFIPPLYQESMGVGDFYQGGIEDCLILSVYTPNLNPETPLPVLFVVHGGAFVVGASWMFGQPDLFMEEDMVVVTVNYRLGLLGFLSLDTEEVPGNNGMKDLVLALKWVRDNIGNFGGNNADVTMIGGSAGAAAVSLLQVSPMTSGLFHKVIAIGGSGLSDVCIQQATHLYTDQFLDLLGLADTSPGDILEALQDLDVEELHSAAQAVQFVKSNPLEEFLFVPSVELSFGNVEAFITRRPREYLEAGEYAHIPTMIGYASFEYASFYNSTAFQEYFNMPSVFVPSEWNLSDNETLLNEVYERVKSFYFEGNTFNPQENYDDFISAVTLGGDLMFVTAIDETAKIMGRYSGLAPTYYYRLSYRGQKLGSQAFMNMGLQGAFHVDDMQYITAVSRDDITDTESDGWVRRRLVKIFSNFAKHGNPTPGPESQLLPIIWDPVTADDVNYLEINGEMVTSKDPDGGRMQFWSILRNELFGY